MSLKQRQIRRVLNGQVDRTHPTWSQTAALAIHFDTADPSPNVAEGTHLGTDHQDCHHGEEAGAGDAANF